MLNLYWKSKDKTRSLAEMPFGSERELERYIFDNQEILGGDIYIIHRQVRTGSKEGIPDMLAVDQDERVCIIELKNDLCEESVLPQALGYAIWAETNPDSIKAIWLESKHRPEEIDIDWDNMDIRVILIAPAFKGTMPRMAGKMGYPIDLIQVRRYGLEEEEFLLVEVLEPDQPVKITTTKVKGDWDWDYYESEHGKEAAKQFRKAVDAIDAFVQQQSWDVRYNLNKSYVSFKLGNRIVITVNWSGTHAWRVEAKVQPGVTDDFVGDAWELHRYYEDWQSASFRPLKPETPDIGELEPFFIAAYKNIAGLK